MHRLPVIQPGPTPAEPRPIAQRSDGTLRLWIDTYGCQMNVHDSERMVQLMAEEGYQPTPDPEDADLLIINSCSVREKAEQKLRSAAGKLKVWKKKRPSVVIALGGCVAQQEGQRLLDRVEHADLVFGPDHLPRLPELVRRVRAERVRLSETAFLDREEYVFPRLSPGAPQQVSAYVSVMKGCDKFCSFCIVPYTRGREVCRSAEEIVAEVRALAEGGTKEVVLLGQTVNTYGQRRVHGEVPFHQLLERVAAVAGIERIRFTSPHPADFTAEQIAAFRDLPQLMPHMHLPVQSGSDEVLRRMRRGYTREQYLEIVDRFREAVPHAALSTDVIVGFPGETEADFEATLSLMERVRYDNTFSFAYSERSGTKAAEITEAVVEPEERRRRLHRLQTLQERHTQQRLAAAVGRRFMVLIEGPSKSDPGRSSGRTPQNRVVHLDGAYSPGALVEADIVEAFAHSLLGRAAANLLGSERAGTS
jgi:tRNA-2-methylthio-N6-dimethylallyladenosine synthase